MSPLSRWTIGRNRKATGKAGRRGRPPAHSKLPPPLFDLRDRLTEAFSLDNLKDLAFDVGINPESVPDDTLQMYALGLARAGWCRGQMEALLAEAARQRPTRAWTIPALPDPPADGCEEDPLPRPSVFGDSRQVATFVLLLLAAAAVVAGGVWQSRRPDRMTHEFNVAVAAIDTAALGGDGDAKAIGQMLQRQVVSIVEGHLRQVAPETTSVSGTRMPVVGSEEEAARLAEQVNAQLVIYGDAQAIAGGARFHPHFYVVLDNIRADVGEMQGAAPIDAPLSFTMAELINESPPAGRTADAAALLSSFVRALVKLSEDNIPEARRFINAAVAQTERYVTLHEPFAGREVIYLFASHIARIQAYNSPEREAHLATAQRHAQYALTLNPNYGRAYVALANLYFDRPEALDQALQTYAAAAALPNQPPQALVPQKAALGMGNVNLKKLLYLPGGTPCVAEARRLADAGLGHYAAVVAYSAAEPSSERLADMATYAHFYSGEIRHFCGQNEAAAAEYRAALALEPAPGLTCEIRNLLSALPGKEDEACAE